MKIINLSIDVVDIVNPEGTALDVLMTAGRIENNIYQLPDTLRAIARMYFHKCFPEQFIACGRHMTPEKEASITELIRDIHKYS